MEVAIIVPIAFFTMIVLVVLILIFYGHKIKNAKYEVMKKAIECGNELPIGFLRSFEKETKKGNPLRSGIIMTLIGIGLFIMCFFVTESKLSGMMGKVDFMIVALVVLSIGIGNLGVYFVEKAKTKKEEKEEENEQ